jgi:hypothetical protein
VTTEGDWAKAKPFVARSGHAPAPKKTAAKKKAAAKKKS